MHVARHLHSLMRHVAFTAALLGLGSIGGLVAGLIGLPLPWMLGALAATAMLVALAPGTLPAGFRVSQGLRAPFIGIIGALIGAGVKPDLLSQAPAVAISLVGVTVFVVAAHWVNYLLFRRIGGYDPATAFYSGAPGGLMESIALGEAAGADLRLLTMQQFLRIILVVSLVPLGLSLLHGQALGSAGGQGFADHGSPAAIPALLAVSAVGLGLGRIARLPAWQLTGPLVVSALAGGLLGVDLAPPPWVLSVAQVVIGVSLGARFLGITRAMLRRGIGLSVLSVTAMLALGLAIAAVLHALTGQSTEVLVLSLAPGGVTEMGLVALSLAANPALVTLHHLFRITLTVVGMSAMARRFRPPPR